MNPSELPAAGIPPDPLGSTSQATASTAASLQPGAGRAARVSSDQLFGGARELQIEHRGALYRLKQTALGKLILTK